MIKTGVFGGDSASAGELIKVLLHHPDVDVRWITSDDNLAGVRIADFHPVLTGESELRFTRNPSLNSVDVVFLCGEPDKARLLLTTVPEIPVDLRIVDVTGEYSDVSSEDGRFVFGIPELNRKALVRGAMRASVPPVVPYCVAMPLLPLAKNLLLGDSVRSAVVGSGIILPENADKKPDNLVSLLESAAKAESVTAETLRLLQSSFCGTVSIIPVAASHTRGIMSVTEVVTGVSVEEARKLYDAYFDDHNFVTLSTDEPTLESVRNTNKCVISLRKSGNRLIVTAVMDDVMKSAAGTAVHIMNLLFGLSEKTGLVK